MAYKLKETTTYLTFSETEAKQIIEDAKESGDGYVIQEAIKRKEKKEEVYYIVSVTTETHREKDITDSIVD